VKGGAGGAPSDGLLGIPVPVHICGCKSILRTTERPNNSK